MNCETEAAAGRWAACGAAGLDSSSLVPTARALDAVSTIRSESLLGAGVAVRSVGSATAAEAGLATGCATPGKWSPREMQSWLKWQQLRCPSWKRWVLARKGGVFRRRRRSLLSRIVPHLPTRAHGAHFWVTMYIDM